mgnify:CR=1 FL=1
MLQPGDKAPDFILSDQSGARIRLAAYHGKPVALFFYPRDGSTVCTREACAFRDNHSEFRELGAVVLGISPDSEASHRRFADRHSLPFSLLVDAGGTVARAFGVPRTLGLLPGRATFVIDSTGVIRAAWSAPFKADAHVRRALETVSSL